MPSFTNRRAPPSQFQAPSLPTPTDNIFVRTVPQVLLVSNGLSFGARRHPVAPSSFSSWPLLQHRVRHPGPLFRHRPFLRTFPAAAGPINPLPATRLTLKTHTEKTDHPRKQHTELTSRQPASPTACSRRQTRGRHLIVHARPMAGAFTLDWEPGHQETTNITPADLSPSDHPTAKVGSFVHSNIRIRTFPGKPARWVEN